METNTASAVVAWVWDRLPRPVRAGLLQVYPLPRFRIGVLAVVSNPRGEVLLLEHRFRARGRWGMPGGWLEPKEAPLEALIRELHEELGIVVAPDDPQLLRVEARESRSHLEVFYKLQTETLDVPPNVEFLSSRYFRLDELPPDLLELHRGIIVRAMT